MAHPAEVTGGGDVIEPEDGCAAVGSGGDFARAAARALLDSDKSAEEIARRAMKIAGDMDIHSNHNIVLETIPKQTV